MASNRRRPTNSEVMVILDAYEPLEVREGGMAKVFICESNIDKKKVAIKTIRPDKALDSSSVRRWLDECHSWMKLGSHPNIVKPIRVHIVDQRPQLVLEFVPESLRDKILAKTALSPAVALKYTVEVCTGLEWAAKCLDKFVHRDLKPENILITESDVAKVTDFGLLTADLGAGNLTVYGEVDRLLPLERDPDRSVSMLQSLGRSQVGTIPYMPPEQILGNVAVDPRADVYALGCILYELISGEFVFSDCRDEHSYLQAHLKTQPRPLGEICPSVSPNLARIVAKCLLKDREQRYPNPVSLSRNLQRLAQGEYGISFKSAPSVSRRSDGDSMGSLIDAFIKLGDLDRARDLSVAPDYNAPDSIKHIQRATIEKHAGDHNLAIEYADRSLDAIEKEGRKDSGGTRAVALDIKAQSLEKSGRLQAALRVQREAVRLAPDLLTVWANLGRLQRIAGDRLAALESFKKSLALGYNPETVRQFVTTAVVAGEFEAAQCEVIKALAVYGEDPSFWFLMAHVIVAKAVRVAQRKGNITRELREECRMAARFAGKAIRAGYLVDDSRKYLEALSSLGGL